MNRSTVLTAAGIAFFIVLAGALAYSIANRQSGPPPAPDPASAMADEALREARERVEALRKERAVLVEETERAAAEKKALEEKVASLEADVAAAREAARGSAKPARGTAKLAFGKHASLEEVLGADWREMALAADAMAKLSADLLDRIEKGEDIRSTSLPIELAKENAKLIPLALALNGKLPTHSSGNGEFTHPIAHWNLLAERLDIAGEPLTEKQIRDLNRLGEDYDREWAALEDSYGADTLELEKLVDELAIKKKFSDRVDDRLTKRQRDIIVRTPYRHVYSVDVHSPFLLAVGRCKTVAKPTREELREAARERFSEMWSLEGAGVEKESPCFDRWLQAVEPILEPVPGRHVELFRIDEAIAAGRAQVALVKELLGSLPLDEGTRGTLRGHGIIVVPRRTLAE